MKHMNQKFLAALLACAVTWMAWAPGAAFARAEDTGPYHKITATLVNKTNATITVHLSTTDKSFLSSSYNQVYGPYSVEPGKKRTVNIFEREATTGTLNEHNAFYQHGFYATSSAGRVWAGEKKKGIDVCIFDGYWSLKSQIEARSDSPSDLKERLKGVKKVVTFRPFLIGKDPQARHEVRRDLLGHISEIWDDYNTILTFTDKGVSIDTHGNANAQQQKKPAAKPTKPAKSAVNANAAIRGNKVNIRSAPNLKAKVLFQLNDGDPVEATGKTAADSNGDDWVQIKMSSGRTAWVFGRYIRAR